MQKTTPSEYIKIVVIGDSNVGKSSLIHRYIEDSYSPDQSNTVGVDFFAKKAQVAGKTYTVQVWDTAGQERFRAMVRTYFRNASAAIVVFDLTKKVSFEHINDWLNEIQEDLDDNTPVLLVGSKADLKENRVISEEAAKALAEKRGLVYFEASAVNSQNVQQLFRVAIEKVVEGYQSAEKKDDGKSTRGGSVIDLNIRPKGKDDKNAGNGCCGF